MIQGDDGRPNKDVGVMLGWLDPVRQALHDIRSPIAALEAAAYQGEGQLPAETLALIQAATCRIRSIAESLKPVTRVTSNGFAVSPAFRREAGPVAIFPVVRQGVEEMRAILAHRNPGIRLSLLSTIDAQNARGITEEAQLARVIANLLQNAVDAIDGSGSIRVSLRRSEDWLILAVRDSGKGIAPELIPHITSRGCTVGKPCGSGLGLSHADENARRWGGRLRIRSELGRGSTVEVWIKVSR